MLLQGKRVYISPYIGSHEEASHLYNWFYDTDYQLFFRHMPTALTADQIQRFPELTGLEVFVIRSIENKEVLGMITIAKDNKTNRGFFIGLIIDKKHQKQGLPLESFVVMLDYCFNRLGYRKAIIEIAENHTTLKKIMDAHKFLFEGKHIEECFIDGKFINELRYSMRANFFNQHYKHTLTTPQE